MHDIKNIIKAISKSIRGFDESTYLQLNPDVMEAVQKGKISSGWQHYILFGYRENRPIMPLKPVINDQPVIEYSYEAVPPARLRKRVHGVEDLPSFTRIGNVVAGNIFDAIDGKFELSEQSRILDFGCGCGRVIQPFQQYFKKGKFYGTDIDEEAIIWCQQNLMRIGEFATNEVLPPLPFDDECFDFVYSISVFTHLPEDMQFAWLEELRRVTKPGGYLVLTAHGKELLYTDSEKIKKEFQDRGFYYSVGTGTEGLPDFYQNSFHTEEYIYRHWSKFFRIITILKKGIANHQDLILCERPS